MSMHPFEECKQKENVNQMYKWVNADFVYNAIMNRVTLIDLRDWNNYNQCHIHKAIHVSIEATHFNGNVVSNDIVCSDPKKLQNIYGKCVILYGNEYTNPNAYDFLLRAIDKQNCGNFRYYVLQNSFEEFQSTYPFLCIWDGKYVQRCKQPLLNQKYMKEESDHSIYQRYANVLLQKRKISFLEALNH